MMDLLTSGSDSDYQKYYIDWFLTQKGHEYFCEIDEEYLLDRFNLTGLNTEVQYYNLAMDLLTDQLEEELEEEVREAVEKSARHLYGLVHARFILTSRGLGKMLEKFKKAEFGRCPRVYCHNQPTLPIGLSDLAYTRSVKLYCPRCEDIYTPRSSRHSILDGAYFGTSFPHMLFQVYPSLLEPIHAANRADKVSDSPVEDIEKLRYQPRIFGFKIYKVSREIRLQDKTRRNMETKLQEKGERVVEMKEV